MHPSQSEAKRLVHWHRYVVGLTLFLSAGPLAAQSPANKTPNVNPPKAAPNAASPKPMTPPPLPSQQTQRMPARAKPVPAPQEQTANEAVDQTTTAPEVESAPPPKAPAGKAIKSIKKKKRKETSDSIVKRRGVESPGYVLVGEAQLLPANVLRMRYVFQNVVGTQGFDENGQAEDVGAVLNAAGHAFALEYGITDRLVLQVIVPVVGANNLSINANKFRKSDEYEEQYQKLVEAVAPALQAKGLCSDVGDCRTKIDAGLALGVDTPVELPTGEQAVIPANVPLKNAADSVILKALEPASGKTGLGDVQVGVAYNVFSSPRQNLTLGIGVRLPTGEYTDVPAAYRAPGAGFTTLGFLARYDIRILNPILISLGNQTEQHITQAVRRRSSILDPTQLNAADPATDDPAIAGEGDGVDNNAPITRKGVLNNGFVKGFFALGAFGRFLNPASIFGSFNWKLDSPYEKEGDDEYGEVSQLFTASYGLTIDGLGLQPRIPISFTYQHDTPVAGKNVLIAPQIDTFQLILYYKF